MTEVLQKFGLLLERLSPSRKSTLLTCHSRHIFSSQKKHHHP
jgi:hypothetical protein